MPDSRDLDRLIASAWMPRKSLYIAWIGVALERLAEGDRLDTAAVASAPVAIEELARFSS